MYHKNNPSCFFFDQIKLIRREISEYKKSSMYDTSTIQLHSENAELVNNNVNDQLSNDTMYNSSSTKNTTRSITLTATEEKMTNPKGQLINKESNLKQLDYYSWVEMSEQIVKDILIFLHQQNVKEIKHPRILDYRLDETWDELISMVDSNSRDWQLPAIKNAYNIWIQENPPEVDAYGMKYESVKKTNSSYGLEIAGAYTPTPRSSVFRKQSIKPSLTNNESMSIHVKTPTERNSNDMQHTSERASNVIRIKRDNSPPKILVSNSPSESSRSTQKLDSLKDSLKHSLPFSPDKENESISATGKESKITVLPTNRLNIPSKHILSTGGDRRIDSRNNGSFTLQFIMSSPESVQKGWINENILISFMDTIEWVCSRLTIALKKNEVSYNYENLQFPRYCEPQYILYSSLLNLKEFNFMPRNPLVNRKMNSYTQMNYNDKDFNDVDYNVIQDTTNNNMSVDKKFSDNKITLLFKVGFNRVKKIRMPIMKLYQITSATSVPSSALIQFYKNDLFNKIEHDLMDNILLSTITNLSITKRIESIPSQITLYTNKSEKVDKSSNILLKLYLEKLANVIQSQKDLMKTNQCTKHEQSYPWISYSTDGTLTVRYPCGSPAIIWSSSPLIYHKPCENLDNSDSSSVNKGKVNKANKPKQFLQSPSIPLQKSTTNVTIATTSTTINSSSGIPMLGTQNVQHRTGFYLSIFGIPLVLSYKSEVDTDIGKIDNIYNSHFSKSSSTTDNEISRNNKKDNSFSTELIQKSRNTARKLDSVRENISSSCSMNSGSNYSEFYPEQTKVDDNLQNEDVDDKKFNIGPLIAHFTPSGDGIVYYPHNINSNNTTIFSSTDHINNLQPANIHAIFTKEYCYMFKNSNGELEYEFPSFTEKSLHDPTIRYPVTLDINLNRYIRLVRTNSHDLTIIFKTEEDVLLTIDCFQNLYSNDSGECDTYDHPMNFEDKSKQLKQFVLSKLPFLSSIVDNTNQNKQLLMSRKRKEESLQKLFKNIPPNDDLQSLSRHLTESMKQISFLCNQWLEIMRHCLGLQRQRTPSPRSAHQLLRYRSLDYMTKGYGTFTNVSTANRASDYNSSVHSDKLICNSFEQKSIRLSKSTSERNISKTSFKKEYLDTFFTNDKNKAPLIIGNDKSSEAILMNENFTSSLNTENNQKMMMGKHYSIVNAADIFPVACPILLRLWLNEIKHHKYFKHLNKLRQLDETTLQHSVELNHDENESLEKAFIDILINPSKFDNQLMSTLSTLSNKGCRCSRHTPPAITDLEFDIFLNKLMQSYQAAVIIVYDSRLPDGIHIGTCDLLCQLYTKQQNTLPTCNRTMDDKIHIVTATEHFSERLYDKYKIAGTGACASISTRMANYRFFIYDIGQNLNNNVNNSQECPLLLKRYNGRPKPGDCLIFIQGKLCFIGSSFTGYEELPWSKQQLDKKVVQCRNQLIKQGFSIPTDFQFV
ncbi:unnamed protein product [Schistosoma rodhaini]|uniref:Uncharacterized protein n=1 Tax=Schistosoma rodhaini TaxID=6188 RepID=A0AA85FV87_9TREM|nr:unnamed protein product [Schistosoma rodhaini]